VQRAKNQSQISLKFVIDPLLFFTYGVKLLCKQCLAFSC